MKKQFFIKTSLVIFLINIFLNLNAGPGQSSFSKNEENNLIDSFESEKYKKIKDACSSRLAIKPHYRTGKINLDAPVEVGYGEFIIPTFFLINNHPFDKDLFSKLIKNGANINLVEDDGQCLLTKAIFLAFVNFKCSIIYSEHKYKQQIEVIRFLLENGADPFLKISDNEADSRTPYEYAKKVEMFDIVSIFDEYKENIDTNFKEENITDLFIEKDLGLSIAYYVSKKSEYVSSINEEEVEQFFIDLDLKLKDRADDLAECFDIYNNKTSIRAERNFLLRHKNTKIRIIKNKKNNYEK